MNKSLIIINILGLIFITTAYFSELKFNLFNVSIFIWGITLYFLLIFIAFEKPNKEKL